MVRTAFRSSAIAALGFASLFVGCQSLGDQQLVDASTRAPVAKPLAPPEFKSGLRIPSDETFHLGGGQRGAFSAEILNLGSTDVRLSARAEDGSVSEVTLIEPGDYILARLNPGDQALLRNMSRGRQARLDVWVRGDSNLGMFYTDNELPNPGGYDND